MAASEVKRVYYETNWQEQTMKRASEASKSSSNPQTFARSASRLKLSKTRLSNTDTRSTRLEDASLNTLTRYWVEIVRRCQYIRQFLVTISFVRLHFFENVMHGFSNCNFARPLNPKGQEDVSRR
jgi:hypothetical protein